jgi:hypothetical protein
MGRRSGRRRLGARGPLVGHELQDLRDDVAGALQDHRVADAQVAALDLVGVVERGVDDGDAADGHGAEAGDGGQGAGAADLDVDGLQDGARLLGGELVGDGPAWLRPAKPNRSCQSSRSTL